MNRLIEMEKNDVDERLIKWNDIFGELLIDSNDLINDLWANINYIAIFGAVMIFIGAFIVMIGRMGMSGLIIFSTWMLFGILQLWRWYRLRSKYNRLRSLQKEMRTI